MITAQFFLAQLRAKKRFSTVEKLLLSLVTTFTEISLTFELPWERQKRLDALKIKMPKKRLKRTENSPKQVSFFRQYGEYGLSVHLPIQVDRKGKTTETPLGSNGVWITISGIHETKGTKLLFWRQFFRTGEGYIKDLEHMVIFLDHQLQSRPTGSDRLPMILWNSTKAWTCKWVEQTDKRKSLPFFTPIEGQHAMNDSVFKYLRYKKWYEDDGGREKRGVLHPMSDIRKKSKVSQPKASQPFIYC